MLCITDPSYARYKKARVLFIGNSLTYVNDLPKLVADVAASTGDTLEYDMSAPGGIDFYTHYSYVQATKEKIQAGGWDFVVLQGQSMEPATPPYNFDRWVYPYATLLAAMVKEYNPCAEVIFYMTWGYKNGIPVGYCRDPSYPYVCNSYQSMDSLLRARYLQMTDGNQATVSPVGAVWRYVFSNYPGIELHDPDGLHPAPAGTYAGACSFYTAIFKKPASGIKYNFSLLPAVAANIRTAATRVVYDSLSNWRIAKYETIAGFTHHGNGMLQVSFINKSVNATHYKWDFGDGQTSTATNPVHTYPSQRIYPVRLIATGASCSDTVYARIKIAKDPGAVLFSIAPNPATDLLYITSDLFSQGNLRIQIMNMTGRLVYEQRASSAETQTINVSGLSSGVYTLIVCSTQKMYHSKIIIQ